jgi:hypothetical protein
VGHENGAERRHDRRRRGWHQQGCECAVIET